jgi:8-oxo-dGTP diphosphatase
MQEEYYLADYRQKVKQYPRIEVCVDLAVYGLDTAGKPHVLLVQRATWPYKGCWALPGGFLDPDESLAGAALRELQEEAGLFGVDPVPLGVADAVHRDPRGRVVSHVFTAHIGETWRSDIRSGDDAADARWFGLPDLMGEPVQSLAFDHMQWVRAGAKHWGLAAPEWGHSIHA